MRREIYAKFRLITLLFASAGIASADWEPSEVVGLLYPPLARMARITGIVIVRLSLGDDGSAREASVLSGHPLLARPAQANAREWRFRQSGRGSSTSDVYLVYRFVLEGTCAGSECRETFWAEYPNFIVVCSEVPSVNTEGADRLRGK
jgi:TonB family protein